MLALAGQLRWRCPFETNARGNRIQAAASPATHIVPTTEPRHSRIAGCDVTVIGIATTASIAKRGRFPTRQYLLAMAATTNPAAKARFRSKMRPPASFRNTIQNWLKVRLSDTNCTIGNRNANTAHKATQHQYRRNWVDDEGCIPKIVPYESAPRACDSDVRANPYHFTRRFCPADPTRRLPAR